MQPVGTRKDLLRHADDPIGSLRIVTTLSTTYVKTENAWMPFGMHGGPVPLGRPVYFSAIDRLAELLEED